VTCNGIAASTTADLRGRAVHVLVGDGMSEDLPVPPLADIPTVTLIVPFGEAASHAAGDHAAAHRVVGPGTCTAADLSAPGAYAVLADLPPDRVTGVEFLIDPNGWLRLEKAVGGTGGWHSEAELLAAIREIYAHPIEQTTGGQHDHRL
jgi:hypothetical protein